MLSSNNWAVVQLQLDVLLAWMDAPVLLKTSSLLLLKANMATSSSEKTTQQLNVTRFTNLRQSTRI